MKMMEDNQRRLIFAECRARGIDDDLRREIVESVTGKNSMKELSKKEAEFVIEKICGKRKKNSTGRRTDEGGNPNTIRMRRKIYMLTEELGWNDNPARIRGYIKKAAGVSALEFLTPRQCFMVIEGLKAMLERGDGNG